MNGEDSKQKSRWILSLYVLRMHECVDDRILYMWKLKYGARVFCMPRMKWSKSKASPIVLLEWLLCFSFAQSKSANARNERFGLQAIGGFFMFSSFFPSFSIFMRTQNAFRTIRKSGKSKGNTSKNAWAFSIYECVLCCICPCISLIADNTSANANTRKGYKISSFAFFASNSIALLLTLSILCLRFFFHFLLRNSTRNIKKCM